MVNLERSGALAYTITTLISVLISYFQQEFYFVVSPCELCPIFRHVDKNKMAA